MVSFRIFRRPPTPQTIFLVGTFFAASYSKTALVRTCPLLHYKVIGNKISLCQPLCKFCDMENGKWKLAGYVHIPFFFFFFSTFLWHTKSRRRFKMDEKNVIDDDDDDTTR